MESRITKELEMRVARIEKILEKEIKDFKAEIEERNKQWEQTIKNK